MNTIKSLTAAIESAMQNYLNNGTLDRHNPAIYEYNDSFHYGSALEMPGSVVVWDLEEGLGSFTPEIGDDLAALAAGAAESMLPEILEQLTLAKR